MSPVRLVIFTRFPEPGRAKTRLIPALGPEGAAMLHRRLTERTVAAARASGLAVEVRTTGAAPSSFADWLGNGMDFVDQGEGDLGERLKRATSPTPVLFIGSDLPDLTSAHLVDAATRMLTERVVVGPAEDGGYWALGLTQGCDALFEAMPWGTDRVLELTLGRLRERGIEPALLPTLADCDRPEDLDRWPEHKA
jgi:rSAM/selenodomain-associated transferase 1